MNDNESARKPMAKEQFEHDGETEYRPVNWRKVFLTPKYIPLHILGIVIAVGTALTTIKHDQVVGALRPFSEKVRDVPGGFLIPIAILIIISFPPLFGHELVALLCGVVYGLWIGFAIVAAGTFFGEIGTWFVFKRYLRKKAIKLERTNLNYGSMARITRDGGFWIVLIIRLSVIPSHFSTAVFSTCDVRFWHFALSTFLTLPKQLVLVYLGVLLLEQGEQSSDSLVKNIVFGIAFIITIILAIYIWMRMRKVKVVLLQEQTDRKAYRDSALSQEQMESHMLHGNPEYVVLSRREEYGIMYDQPPQGRYEQYRSQGQEYDDMEDRPLTPLGPKQQPGASL